MYHKYNDTIMYLLHMTWTDTQNHHSFVKTHILLSFVNLKQ